MLIFDYLHIYNINLRVQLTYLVVHLLGILFLVLLQFLCFFFPEEDGIRDGHVTGVQTCALPIYEIAVVFQSAMNALNPVTTIHSQFDDVIRVHRPGLAPAHRTAVAAEHLERVGIDPSRIDAYPHELSGGMKQRVAIAIALVLEPDVIFMDEPTTALDLLVQRDVLDQIVRLREDYGFAIVFTTHDLALLLELSDSIAVMRRGRLVEYGPAMDVYRDAQHPYTKEDRKSVGEGKREHIR